MKTLVISSLLLLLASTVFSQETSTRFRNEIQLNVGKTLYDGYQYQFPEKGINRVLWIVSYNGQFTDRIGLGLYAGFTSSRVRLKADLNLYDYTTSEYTNVFVKASDSKRRFFIGPKVTFYFLNSDKFQFFGNAGLGVTRLIVKRKIELTPNINAGSDLDPYRYKLFNLSYDLQIGANYYFYKNWGITSSLGYKTGIFRIGLTYKY